MDSGALPSTEVGTHRRTEASDLLEFHERRQAAHQTLADARADAPIADRHHFHDTAPLSDTALSTSTRSRNDPRSPRALLDRLRAETTVDVVELNTTVPAEGLYRGLRSTEPRDVALQARVR
ncbi:hypothetical protein [Cellulosimicrobium cellulans]|uniref:hypothetical protein n=1 Tax=Cellulosimicrobium cellulans TaxID=1710 RepID=UPI00130E02F1|nr:hypothetical protein [Cellulosimicrobium cellulans]